ncbi:MAG TPA: response regulator transcription factor [Coriobacteriia bacterium]|jgi:DNA-binding response OmpR family regulator
MRILLVEDEDRIASFVVKGLQADGHVVERAADVAGGKRLVTERPYDLVLLDLLLADGNGAEVLEAVRARDAEVPVVVLSALGEVDDKVSLLDRGADDYLTKPFSMRELSARVRAHARHGQVVSHSLTVGDLELDTRTRVAKRGAASADLPSREYSLLEYLMRHPGQVLTRQQLLDAVWGFDFDTGSNVVDVYVGYLRRKLDTPGEPSVIETVRGAGYRVPA